MSIRKSLLVFLLIPPFCPCPALSQSPKLSESQQRAGTLAGLQPCGERYRFERSENDASEKYSREREHGSSQTCKEFFLDRPPQQLLSTGTPSARAKQSVPPIGDLILGSNPVPVSYPDEELKDIGLAGTAIAGVRQAVLEILESENKCSAWFRHSDPDVSATFRSLNFAVDEAGSDRVIREQNDRGAWIEHGPYIARTMQNTATAIAYAGQEGALKGDMAGDPPLIGGTQ